MEPCTNASLFNHPSIVLTSFYSSKSYPSTVLSSRQKVQSLHIYQRVPFNISLLFQPLCSNSKSNIMAIKIKGIYKSFKYISQIFVVKDREMEIGSPTDVKHVAHIGLHGSSGSSPTWMNEFKIASDNLTPTSIRNINPTSFSTRSAQDFEQPVGSQTATEMTRNRSCTDIPNVTKKQKQKKTSTSISKSASSKSARISKTHTVYTQLGSEPNVGI